MTTFSEQQALMLIGSQALELAVLRGQVARFAEHECVPTPCPRDCCATVSETNPEESHDDAG